MTPITFADTFRTQSPVLTRNQLKTLRAKTRRHLPVTEWASAKRVVVGSDRFHEILTIVDASLPGIEF